MVRVSQTCIFISYFIVLKIYCPCNFLPQNFNFQTYIENYFKFCLIEGVGVYCCCFCGFFCKQKQYSWFVSRMATWWDIAAYWSFQTPFIPSFWPTNAWPALNAVCSIKLITNLYRAQFCNSSLLNTRWALTVSDHLLFHTRTKTTFHDFSSRKTGKLG